MPGIEWDGVDAKLFSRLLAELFGQHIGVRYILCLCVDMCTKSACDNRDRPLFILRSWMIVAQQAREVCDAAFAFACPSYPHEASSSVKGSQRGRGTENIQQSSTKGFLWQRVVGDAGKCAPCTIHGIIMASHFLLK